MKTLIYILLVTLVVGSCVEEPRQIEDNIDIELIEYFERFVAEADKRGIRVTWEEGIQASIKEVIGAPVGQCLTYESGLRQINIDIDYWSMSNSIQKEFLVFHELGHCLLQRSHDDTSGSDGYCRSIMSSGEGFCRENYTSRTRDDYLDELF